MGIFMKKRSIIHIRYFEWSELPRLTNTEEETQRFLKFNWELRGGMSINA